MNNLLFLHYRPLSIVLSTTEAKPNASFGLSVRGVKLTTNVFCRFRSLASNGIF